MEEQSAVAVYSEGIQKAIEAVPKEIRDMDEQELAEKFDPGLKLYEVKRAFWEEYTQAQMENRKMRVYKVHEAINKDYFYKIIKDPYKMAWILHPMQRYENKIQAVLDKAVSRYNELIGMEITTIKRIKDENGDYRIIEEVDPRKAAVLFQVIKSVEDRVKGSAVQRQVSVHTDRPRDAAGAGTGALNMDAVNERLQELERKLGGTIEERPKIGERARMASGDEEIIDIEVSGAEGEVESSGYETDADI